MSDEKKALVTDRKRFKMTRTDLIEFRLHYEGPWEQATTIWPYVGAPGITGSAALGVSLGEGEYEIEFTIREVPPAV